jgi:hypothetical protein
MQIRGSLPYATDDETVCCSGRDDECLGEIKKTNDHSRSSSGMTTKRQIQGFFAPLRMTTLRIVGNDEVVVGSIG